MMERDLLATFKQARIAVDICEQALKDAKAAERGAEQAVIAYLEAKGASATAKYPDLGYAQINKPRLFASATQEVLPKVMDWLRAHGHESAIKETVHPSTLSQIVGEQLSAGSELPPGVTYYLRPNVALYGGSNG